MDFIIYFRKAGKTKSNNNKYNKIRENVIYNIFNIDDDYLEMYGKYKAKINLEIVKERLWKPEVYGLGETKKAQMAIYTSLYGAVRGLSPFMPYITEEVYEKFFSNYENEIINKQILSRT